MAEAGWSDERPNDHDRLGLSRIAPCPSCGHDEHGFTQHCGALVDLRVVDIFCPCRCPVLGVYA